MFAKIENEHDIIQIVKRKTNLGNIDNISRTKHYEIFYFDYKEIKWSLLASLVSRNAGWNMCDLEGDRLVKLMSVEYRRTLFSMYERANWLIFNDAYPQLLIYHYSTKYNKPLFHLLRYFRISEFMIDEWQTFWKDRDETRLLYALIINEQNLIQKPIIANTVYHKRIFNSLPYRLQEKLHFNVILFPTLSGKIYGASMKKFQNVHVRIEFGKQLSWILFDSGYLQEFIHFIKKTVHTGSRYDYEKYFSEKMRRDTPYLRFTYPIIEHVPEIGPSWDQQKKVKRSWFHSPKIKDDIEITNWYKKKLIEMSLLKNLQEWIQLNQ
ncbi:DUF2515 domain-containing protein [Caldibacillus thermolactis]|uniref:DUF2515 domain-containing protein n=2 Tax=Pallidibacillus thermolactis TaxID=251051 RepID=A0ABT2WD99_9BACI|nr:DUF2515 domain-containing protein [Pallidibacillus thermolactis]MCU9593661.1 DUF2515 domain-containing protein [Pallidibacillus thermolactis]